MPATWWIYATESHDRDQREAAAQALQVGPTPHSSPSNAGSDPGADLGVTHTLERGPTPARQEKHLSKDNQAGDGSGSVSKHCLQARAQSQHVARRKTNPTGVQAMEAGELEVLVRVFVPQAWTRGGLRPRV